MKKINLSFTNAFGAYSAVVYLPDWTGKHPLVVFCHGNPGFTWIYTWVSFLADLGYVVMLFHPPSVDKPLLPDAFAAGFYDSVQALMNSRQGRYIDFDTIIYAGHSMGAVAAFLGAQGCNRIIALAPPYPTQSGGDPDLEAANKWMRESSLHLGNTPVLVIVGSQDGIVGSMASKVHCEQMKAVGTPCSLNILDGGSHIGFIDAWAVDLPFVAVKMLKEPGVTMPHREQLETTMDLMADWLELS